VGFEARTGKRVELREQSMRILEPTPAEAGCVEFIGMSVCVPGRISSYILNGWRRAFAAHAELPHMKRFWDRWGS
jgi:quinol monooxygenase YgiN